MIKAIEDRDIIRRLSATAPPPVKLIMQLMLEDLTFAEIGERLDLSARAVEGRGLAPVPHAGEERYSYRTA